jgi:hypothetical protein
MHALYLYVNAIHGHATPVAIVRRESTVETWQDQDCKVTKTTTIYWFENGAIIRQSIEQDDFPSETACAESWIDYSVIAHGRDDNVISPAHKVFDNACRESFWLKYHSA